MDNDELKKRFGPLAINGAQITDLKQLEVSFTNLAEQLVRFSAQGRELSTALTKLEEALNWATKAVARRE